MIADELMRLRRLADRLLLLASGGSRFPAPRSPDALETIVMDAVRRWTATPRRWLLAAAEEATAMADADRLEVALDALIENAVHHTQTDTIEVGVRADGHGRSISVRDTGTGIPAADLDRIFDRFARAGPGSEPAHGRLRARPVDRAGDRGGPRRHGPRRERRGARTTFEIMLPIVHDPVAATADGSCWSREMRVIPSADPIVLFVAVAGVVYATADQRVRNARGRPAPRVRRWAFFAGLGVLLIALIGPIDAAVGPRSRCTWCSTYC